MDPKIIFENESLIVLDKPSGWITNEADTTTNQPVIQTWLYQNLVYPISNTSLLRSGVVHRLDKETSGILLVAKTEAAFEDLQRQFKERIVKKTYIALLHGIVDPNEGEIKTEVGRLPWRRDRFGVLPGGRDSLTIYKVLSVFSSQLSDKGLPVSRFIGQTERPNNLNPKTENRKPITGYFSLVELYPQTGRTHQIRIHAKYIGHPIVSDEFYAGRKTARKDRLWCPRLFLHASGVTFNHPKTGSKIEFKSEIPEDLQSSLDKLEIVKVR